MANSQGSAPPFVSQSAATPQVRKRSRRRATGDEQTAPTQETALQPLEQLAHEVRTPLNIMLNRSRLLLAEPDDLNATQRHHVEAIIESGLHMMHLIDSMLELPLIASGQLTLQTIPIAPASAIADAVTPLEPMAIAKQQQLIVVPIEGVPDVSAEPVRLGQILNNLVLNAIKFTQNGGTIEVGARGGPNGAVEFFVRDNGPGIAKKYHKAIFQPIFQVTSGRKHRQHGIGLGLALARQLARLHGGDIWVDSVWRKGSTFWVRLPGVVGPEAGVISAGSGRAPITSPEEAGSS
jgi:signal transduction histidine kinase